MQQPGKVHGMPLGQAHNCTATGIKSICCDSAIRSHCMCECGRADMTFPPKWRSAHTCRTDKLLMHAGTHMPQHLMHDTETRTRPWYVHTQACHTRFEPPGRNTLLCEYIYATKDVLSLHLQTTAWHWQGCCTLHICKLGPALPGHVVSLAEAISTATSSTVHFKKHTHVTQSCAHTPLTPAGYRPHHATATAPHACRAGKYCAHTQGCCHQRHIT
jgi:hypothetical protein